MIFDKEYANQMLDRLIDRIYNSNKYRLNKFLSDGESIAEEKEISHGKHHRHPSRNNHNRS